MIKKTIIIGACLVAFLSLNFLGKAFFRQRNALNVVRNVMACWEENDLPQSYKYWNDERKSPPVYDLMTYEIWEATFAKEDGVYTASVPVTLYFPTSHPWPSGKVWTFTLHKTPYGWKIMDFRRSSP